MTDVRQEDLMTTALAITAADQGNVGCLVQRWYRNIGRELAVGPFDAKQAATYREYYREAGLLRAWRRNYFHRHFGASFARIASFLLASGSDQTILDLGCGCGTQALFLALTGARVVALDADPVALSVLETRRRFYEGLLGRGLNIRTVCGDALRTDYTAFGRIDGLVSMFAFNMMQPTSRMLELVTPAMVPGARLALIDVNRECWLWRLLPWRRRPTIWSPTELRAELEARDFLVHEHTGGPVLPPLCWTLGPAGMVRWIDRAALVGWNTPVSQLLLATFRHA